MFLYWRLTTGNEVRVGDPKAGNLSGESATENFHLHTQPPPAQLTGCSTGVGLFPFPTHPHRHEQKLSRAHSTLTETEQ